jgi:hypothetical protein
MKSRVLEEQLGAFQHDSRSKTAGTALQKIIDDESHWKDVEREKVFLYFDAASIFYVRAFF